MLDPEIFRPYRLTPTTRIKPARPVFAPQWRPRADIDEDLRRVERADQDLRRYEADEATAHRILRDALTRNAYGTASIEGNPLTLAEVESLLAIGPTPENLEVPQEREILNLAAMMRRMDQITTPATPAQVAQLHAELFEHVLTDAGRFKTSVNFIGRKEDRTVVFVPTPPERVEGELTALLEWWRTSPWPPLVRAIVVFHEVQAIHPFRDGNGRLGRFLCHKMLEASGYPGVRYALIDYAFNADRQGYYGALAEADKESPDVTHWVGYMARMLRRTYEEAVRRFLWQTQLPKDLNERQVRLAEWFARMHRENPRRQVKVADVHAANPQIPRRTLQADLATLRDAGVVHSQGVRKGTSYKWAA
jgi:Fic family protein